jgi:hypothetical protein
VPLPGDLRVHRVFALCAVAVDGSGVEALGVAYGGLVGVLHDAHLTIRLDLHTLERAACSSPAPGAALHALHVDGTWRLTSDRDCMQVVMRDEASAGCVMFVDRSCTYHDTQEQQGPLTSTNQHPSS